MSPISFNTFRTIPSNLDLNGPYLSFTKQPVSAATTSGSFLELTGIATVSFLENSSPENTGIITYKWYETGVGPVIEGSNATGTATTVLSLSNLVSPTDNNRKFFLQADYVGNDVTGNATNEPLQSNEVTVTVFPDIEIIGQPTDASTIVNSNVSFTVNASLTDASFTEGLLYQWSVNGQDVTDGVLTLEVPATRVEQTFSSPATHTIPASGQDVEITMAGAAGGTGGTDAGGSGGAPGNGRVGTFSYANGPRILDIYIGSKGSGGSSGNNDAGGAGGSGIANGGAGGGAGPGGWSGGGGGGGAVSAILDRSIQTNQGGGAPGMTIVAGGGGGGGGASLSRSGGGAGAATRFIARNQPITVQDGANGGTKSSGDGGGAGAGGAGEQGGGGGSPGNDNSSGASGGSGGSSAYDQAVTSLLSESTDNDGNGYGFIKYNVPDGSGTETITTNITISGSSTETLTLASSAVGVTTVACRVSHPTATNSPQQSEDAKFVVLDNANQYILNVEGIDNTDEANLSTVDLFNGDLVLTTSTPEDGSSVAANYWVLYAPDKDIFIEMDVYGGKGDDNGSFIGGEGGFSRIRFNMERNVEYVVTGLNDLIRSPFIYRKGQLIAVVGGGGNAGTNFNGGFGGGINVDGQDGFGRYGGSGGESVTNGTLSLDGVFGSLFSTTTTVDNDTIATGVAGGRAISCTKGVYYRNQGYSACEDIGTTQFRQSDGTVVTNTADITRGFKAGYSIVETNGVNTTNGGRGAAGATGGAGGEQGAGGGGGSGYSDGSVTVISSILGGSNDVARINVRVVQGGVVTFTQSRTSTENIFVQFSLVSGDGPSTLEFGSRSGFSGTLAPTIKAELSQDAVYEVTALEGVDSINATEDGTTLTAVDNDSRPGTLTIVADTGIFASGTDPTGTNITNMSSTTYSFTTLVSQTVTDNKGNISAGSPFTVTRVIDYSSLNPSSNTEGHPIGSIKYVIDITGYSSPTLFVRVLDTATRGSGLEASDNSIAISEGYPKQLSNTSFEVAFDMTNSTGPGRQATAVRSFSLNLTGT